jgi:hypothetical protein
MIELILATVVIGELLACVWLCEQGRAEVWRCGT